MIFESFVGNFIAIAVILLALGICYRAGWQDGQYSGMKKILKLMEKNGMRNEKEKIKKEIKGI